MLAILYLAYLLVCLLVFKALWRSQWALLDSWCLLMAAVFPVLGLVAAIAWRRTYQPKGAADLLARHQAARFEPVVNYASMRAQAENDADSLALKPLLHTDNAAGHTQAVIQIHQAGDLPQVGNLLQVAMDSRHVDTVHYAATTWLSLEKRHQVRLQTAQQAYQEQPSLAAGKRLVAAYRAYLDSALVQGQALARLWREFGETAERLSADYPAEWRFWAAAVDCQLHFDDYRSARQTLDQAAAAGVKNAPLQYRRLICAYASRDFAQVQHHLSRLGGMSQLALSEQERERITLLREAQHETG